MKVYVKEQGKPAFRVAFPTSLLTGRLGCFVFKSILKGTLKNRPVPVRPELIDGLDLSGYSKRIKAVKKNFPGLYIVDIQDKDGTQVKVKL